MHGLVYKGQVGSAFNKAAHGPHANVRYDSLLRTANVICDVQGLQAKIRLIRSAPAN